MIFPNKAKQAIAKGNPSLHERALELGKIRTKLYSHPVNLGEEGKRKKKRRNNTGQS